MGSSFILLADSSIMAKWQWLEIYENGIQFPGVDATLNLKKALIYSINV